jgi:hypothetical protein
MPLYPLSIIFSQRNASNTRFDEKYLSGSNILFGTDANGNLTAIDANNIQVDGAATTGSNTFYGDQIISGSLYATGSVSAPSGSFIFFQLNTTGSAPNTPSDPGLIGEVRLDDNYIYVYVQNRWKRISVAIWS